MTKNIFKIILFSAFAFLMFFTACNKKEPLSKLRQKEREAIANYIKDTGINVLSELPADTIMADPKDYLLDTLGMYINISNLGDRIPPKRGDEIRVGYYEITMEGDTVTYAMENGDLYSPIEFTYGSTPSVVAFALAVKYMGHLGEADLIVPSAIGASHAQLSITPYRYKIKIMIK